MTALLPSRLGLLAASCACLLAAGAAPLVLGEALAGLAGSRGLLAPARARAHGGQVLPPPEAPPPAPPRDPLPPRPPVPVPPRPPTITQDKPQGATQPAVPVPGPVLAPPAVPESVPTRPSSVRPDVRAGLPSLGRRGAGSTSSSSLSDWDVWWGLVRAGWLPARERGLRAGAVTAGPGEAPDPAAAEARQAALALEATLPLLERLAGPEVAESDVRASALLALARTSTAPGARAHVVRAARDAAAPALVRESAALALGLFRRSEGAARLPAADVERLREAALGVLDDDAAPMRVRCFAAFALGLLGDQAFHEQEALGAAAWIRVLWSRLAAPRTSAELPVAVLVALSRQPAASVLEPVREGLRSIVVGRQALGRTWSEVERAHALACLSRLAPGPALADLQRVLQRRGEAEVVVRAAALAAPGTCRAHGPDGRAALFAALARARDQQGDPWTRGLLRVSLARVLQADLAAGDGLLGVGTGLEALLDGVDRVRGPERGYAVLSVGLAGHGPAAPGAWARRARARLLEGLAQEGDDPAVRGAHAAALGLLGGEGAVAPLVALVGDRDAPAVPRGHGALALAMLRPTGPEALRAVVLALGVRSEPGLRSSAALALATLRAREALPLLLREAADEGASEHVRAQAAAALGQLADLGAVPALAALAADVQRSEQVRALAVVALGLVLDPEPRPSLLALALDATYCAPTDALREMLSIL